jgi:hypothetical protein
MKDPNKELAREVAKMIADEQAKLMAEMRRRTTLDDGQIRELLSPFSEAAFGSGYKLGWRDAEMDLGARAGRWKLAAMLSSAALMAWWIVSALLKV